MSSEQTDEVKADSEPQSSENGSSKLLIRVLMALPLTLFGVLAVVFFFRVTSGEDISQIPSVLINKQAPVFELVALDGLTNVEGQVPGFATENLSGQISLVNVFASWCVPCRQEHPLLLELARRDDIQIVGINKDDAPHNALQFLFELGNPYDRVGVDRNGRISLNWGVYGVPETFLVDAEGCIRAKHIGVLTEAAMVQNINPLIEALKSGRVTEPCEPGVS